jgi:hypothetical protein
VSFFSKITALTFALLLLGGLSHASAQLPAGVDLINGNSVTFDGLSFTVSGCTLSLNGGTANACTNTGTGDTNDLLQITNSRRGEPTIEVLGNGTGTAGGSGSVAKGSNALACNNCLSASELKFTLTLQQAQGKTPAVTSFSNAIVGGTPTGSTSVISNVTYNGTGATANVTLGSPTASASFSNALTSASPISFAVDLKLMGNGSSILALAAEALHFSPAPEPASIALLVTGLAGLVAARRHIKRSPRSATRQG